MTASDKSEDGGRRTRDYWPAGFPPPPYYWANNTHLSQTPFFRKWGLVRSPLMKLDSLLHSLNAFCACRKCPYIVLCIKSISSILCVLCYLMRLLLGFHNFLEPNWHFTLENIFDIRDGLSVPINCERQDSAVCTVACHSWQTECLIRKGECAKIPYFMPIQVQEKKCFRNGEEFSQIMKTFNRELI